MCRYLQDSSGSIGTVGDHMLRDGLPVNLGDLFGAESYDIGGCML